MISNSSNDITQLIRIKERELHDIHDLRCSQLEKLLAERDNILLDCSRKFEQLKDDFTFNLTLLEARDQEIRRLEGVVDASNSRINSLEVERKSLQEKLDMAQLRFEERQQQVLEEKAANKVISCCTK